MVTKRQEVKRLNKVKNILVSYLPTPLHVIKIPSCQIKLQSVVKVNNAIQMEMMILFESNMKDLYEGSSWGYCAMDKKNELFHKDARYLLLYTNSSHDENMIGYLHYRFHVEENGELVFYIYELQIKSNMQRLGIGKKVMILCSLLCKQLKCIDKMMLTVFTANEKAKRFYTTLGYSIDDSSPCANEEGGKDYRIMSKTITGK